MAVRNFWLSGNVEGRQSELKGGPRSKEGGMDIDIYQRDQGSITKALRISSRAEGEMLKTTVYDEDGNAVHTVMTER